jgi:hypothetical protein
MLNVTDKIKKQDIILSIIYNLRLRTFAADKNNSTCKI